MLEAIDKLLFCDIYKRQCEWKGLVTLTNSYIFYPVLVVKLAIQHIVPTAYAHFIYRQSYCVNLSTQRFHILTMNETKALYKSCSIHKLVEFLIGVNVHGQRKHFHMFNERGGLRIFFLKVLQDVSNGYTCDVKCQAVFFELLYAIESSSDDSILGYMSAIMV